jgi:hypothetical protein
VLANDAQEVLISGDIDGVRSAQGFLSFLAAYSIRGYNRFTGIETVAMPKGAQIDGQQQVASGEGETTAPSSCSAIEDSP